MRMDVGMDGWMFAKFSNVNEPSNEARRAAESCTRVHCIYSVVQLGQDNLYDTLSSTCLAELVAHSG